MRTIDHRRFGFALGATCLLLYLGCAFMMAALPRETVFTLSGTLVHGVDWGPLVEWDAPWHDTVMGTFCVFVLGWLVWETFAAIYNLSAPRTT